MIASDCCAFPYELYFPNPDFQACSNVLDEAIAKSTVNTHLAKIGHFRVSSVGVG